MYNLIDKLKILLEFEKGFSIIIKGPPGSGKTTFALTLLENLKSKNKQLYFSTRVGDESLHKQFPWLKNLEKNIQIMIASELFLAEIYKEEKEKESKIAAKQILKELNKERAVSKLFYQTNFHGKKSPEIQHLYKEVESALPLKSIVVIDSLEGISGKYKINESTLAYTIQKDLVENADTSVIFVSEKDYPSNEDYIVDGVINLTQTIEDGRRFREITLKKLRGILIKESTYSFTLNSGRFNVIQPLELNNKKIGKWDPIPDLNGYYSTGINDLDKILGGGIKYGSFFNIQIEKEVPVETWRIIEIPLIINFFLLNYGVLGIPTPGYSYNKNKKYFSQWVPPDIIDKNTVYIDYSISQSEIPNVVPLGGMDTEKAAEMHREAVYKFLNKFEKGISIINHDFFEYSVGPEITLKNIFSNLSAMKSTMHIVVSMTKPGQKITSEISNISDYQFRVTTRDGGTFIYGIKPRTIYYSIEVNHEKGLPYLKLIPVE